MTTQSFPKFAAELESRISGGPQSREDEIQGLIAFIRRGGSEGRAALVQLRAIPGGIETLNRMSAAPAPVPAPVPPPAPGLFDKTLGRGIGAVGRGVLGVGRWSQPVTTPILENLG